MNVPQKAGWLNNNSRETVDHTIRNKLRENDWLFEACTFGSYSSRGVKTKTRTIKTVIFSNGFSLCPSQFWGAHCSILITFVAQARNVIIII